MEKIIFLKIVFQSLSYLMLGLISLGVCISCAFPFVHIIITGTINDEKAIFLDYFFYFLLFFPSFFILWISYNFFKLAFNILFNKKAQNNFFLKIF